MPIRFHVTARGQGGVFANKRPCNQSVLSEVTANIFRAPYMYIVVKGELTMGSL
jgi:hypothetical protein